jgi:hypothetical protein
MVYLIGATCCLGLSILSLGLPFTASVGASSAASYLPWFSFSLAAAAVGLVFCGLGWRRSRTMAVVLGLAQLLPGAGSSLFIREGLAERAVNRQIYRDIGDCAVARKNGTAPIPRTDKRYRASIDNDGDGLACEYSSHPSVEDRE